MKKTSVVISIFVLLFTGSYYYITQYSLNTTHQAFIKTVAQNPEVAYFHLTPQIHKKVNMKVTWSYNSLHIIFKDFEYRPTTKTLYAVKEIQTDPDPHYPPAETRKIKIKYALERTRWVVINVQVL